MVTREDGLSENVVASVERNALLNALRHDGKAEVGAVISKVIGDYPELRTSAKEVARAVEERVREVNAMTVENQRALLRERYSDADIAPREREEGRIGLPPLPNVKGALAFRLPPEPSGFMHIGHGMAFTINSVYAERYNGKLWLRFEDTNPRKVEPRYYESFREGSRWLGIKWDYEKSVSRDTVRVRSEASLGGERVCLRMRRGEGEEAQVLGDSMRAQGAVFREEPGDLEPDDFEEIWRGGVRHKTEGRDEEP